MTSRASQDARPTLAAVAARAGVSASTASLAFSGAGPVSDATRERVLAAASELGYAGPDPRARSLRRGRSGIVGVVIEDRLRDAFRDPVNIAMLDGVSDALGSAGYALLLLTDPGEGSPQLEAAPLDGVILVGCSRELDDSVELLGRRGIPVVAIEAEPLPGVVPIDLDNRAATARAAAYLRELGHENVALVTLPLGAAAPGPLDPQAEARSRAHTTLERMRGARDIYPSATGVSAAGSSVEDGIAAGHAVLDAHPDATAVIAQSDLLALGVIRAAGERGLRVPDDLSVVGFDGIRPDDAGEIVLTTLVQPAVDKGRAAGRAVVALLDDPSAPPTPASFTSELRIGTTTAPPRR